jgi:hypothetical protein
VSDPKTVDVLNDVVSGIQFYRDLQRRGSNAWKAADRILGTVERIALRHELGDEADPAIIAERHFQRHRMQARIDTALAELDQCAIECYWSGTLVERIRAALTGEVSDG